MNSFNNNQNKSAWNVGGLSSSSFGQFSESSPPAEELLNDEALPSGPMQMTAQQSFKQPMVNTHNHQAIPLVSQQPFHPPINTQNIRPYSANPTQHNIPDISVRPFCASIPIQSHSISFAASSSYAHTGMDVSSSADEGVIDTNRQFRFSKPNPRELRKQIQEILRTLNTFPLLECHDKVKWFASVTLQQLLDLELYDASSSAVEKCSMDQLKRLNQFKNRARVLMNEKKQIEQKVTKQTEELNKHKNELILKSKELKQYELKFKGATTEVEKVKTEKTKELEEEKRRTNGLEMKVKEVERERDEYKRRMKEMGRKEEEAKRKTKELEEKSKRTEVEGAEMDVARMKMELKTRNAELERTKMELKEGEKSVGTLETQLRESRAQADTYRHGEMKYREKLRRRTEKATQKIEEQQRQLEEAQKSRSRMEEELKEAKAAQAKKVRKKEKPEGTAIQEETQFDARIREVVRRKSQLDRAIESIGSKLQDCVKCPLLEKEMTELRNARENLSAEVVQKDEVIAELKRIPKVTIRLIDPNSNPNIQQIQSEETQTIIKQQSEEINQNESRKRNADDEVMMAETNKRMRSEKVSESQNGVLVQSESCDTSSTSVPSAKTDSTTLAEPSTQQQLQNSDATLNTGFPLSLSCITQSNTVPPFLSAVRQNEQPSQAGHGMTALSSSPIPLSVSHRQPPIHPSADHRHPPMPSASSVPFSSAADHDQSRVSLSPSSTVGVHRPSTNSLNSQRQYPSPITSPALSNDNNERDVASKIVTSFMLFVSRHPDRNARSLISDYLQQSGIPSQYQPIIASQLNLIASASENVRNQL